MTADAIPSTMLACEAREWIARIRREGHTLRSGEQRLAGILADIEGKRGAAAAEKLRAAIARERRAAKGAAA